MYKCYKEKKNKGINSWEVCRLVRNHEDIFFVEQMCSIVLFEVDLPRIHFHCKLVEAVHLLREPEQVKEPSAFSINSQERTCEAITSRISST